MNILRKIQTFFLGISFCILAILPLYSAFGEDSLEVKSLLYDMSFLAVFLVILIRPLADIFSSQKWLHRLIFLRKGVGIFSASIVVGYMLGAIIMPESRYIASIFTVEYWSFQRYLFFAHLGDLTGLLLLLTSNNFSLIVLKDNWKRLQKLAYVYFYAGGIYEYFAGEKEFALWAMLIAGSVSLVAFIINTRQKTK